MKPKGAAEIVQATRLKLAQPRYSFATFHPGSPSPLPPCPPPHNPPQRTTLPPCKATSSRSERSFRNGLSLSARAYKRLTAIVPQQERRRYGPCESMCRLLTDKAN